MEAEIDHARLSANNGEPEASAPLQAARCLLLPPLLLSSSQALQRDPCAALDGLRCEVGEVIELSEVVVVIILTELDGRLARGG